MAGRTWKKITEEKAQLIKEYLLEKGGDEQNVSSPYEAWRIRFSDSTFTYYTSGKLHSTPSNSNDPAVIEAWEWISNTAGSSFITPNKDYLIGLDETGKGELVGHLHLVGVVFPSKLFPILENITSTADTKKRHPFSYWDELYKKISQLAQEGLGFIHETIPPWQVDEYNLNKIMDVVYQRILANFLRELDVSKCRIVIDDYGVGPTLRRFLNFLEKRGGEVIVVTGSEDEYLEARVASLIAKRQREGVVEAINRREEFKVNGLSIGSGNASDVQTRKWLEAWYQSGEEWPWFVKRSYKTVREIEGRDRIPKKTPPIRDNLLSKEFRSRLEEGELSIQFLSVICPHCGNVSKAVNLTGGEEGFTARCVSCKNPIEDLSFTLRCYCGFIIPDSNIIRRGLLGKDLSKGRFFENFTILVPAVVRWECDTSGGKKEFERLGKFAAVGRIHIAEIGELERGRFEALSSQERDDLILKACIEKNAILLTADNQLKGIAMARKVFTIFVT